MMGGWNGACRRLHGERRCSEDCGKALVRVRFSIIAVAAIFVLGSADAALAWGPAMHVGLATSLLEQLSFLPAAVGALLARHGVAFLYGNVAADVVFAKRWSRIKQSCHHWSTAFALLEAARDDRDRAFGFGYLSHLAADTVAHGKYVPRQIMLSQCTVNFGHLFWELRADATETEAAWGLLESVLDGDHAHHHQSLEGQIAGTFLPYFLNRRLFYGMNALTMRRAFRRTVGVWNRHSRWYLSPALVDAYRVESLGRVISVLTDGSRSSVVREDPNGTSALMYVRVHRRDVRRLRRRRLPVKRRVREAARGLAPRRTSGELLGIPEAPTLVTGNFASDAPALHS